MRRLTHGGGGLLLPFLLAVLLALTASSCGRGADGAKPFGPETVDEIDAVVAGLMERSGAPGALVGIWMEDGTVLVKAYGLADTATEEAMREDLSFRIGSITKTFTGNVVLQLVDEGELSLDDPVSKFVGGIPDGETITVRMLLNHSSGIFNYGLDTGLNETIVADPHKVWTPRELVDVGISSPPYFPPGEGCMYSNTNYILLGMIVEEVTGRSFEEELADRITGPLGLDGTYMAEGPGLGGDHAHGYQVDVEGGESYDLTDYLDPSISWTAGGMVSTLEDLRVWGRALAEGQLLSPGLREEMTSGMLEMPGIAEFFGHGMLYGLAVIDFGGWLGHGGMQPGYTSAVYFLPQKEATVVTMVNISDADEQGTRLFMQVTEVVFPGETPW
ncbi:MAG: serine hydrolase domain-containing protein [Actinomycetota bacterium]